MSHANQTTITERIDEGLLTTSPTSIELTPKILLGDLGDETQEIPRKIIINHISPYTAETELRQLCATKGQMTSFNMVYDRQTGQRKGYAFAEYSQSIEAVQAANELNGTQMGTHFLKACLSRPQDPTITNANLHITGIPKSWVIIDLFNYFRFLGQLVSCKLLTDPVTRMSRGIGFVRFANHQQASDARSQLNGQKPYGEVEPFIITYAHSHGPSVLRRRRETNSSGSSSSGTTSPALSQTTSVETQPEASEPTTSYLMTLPMPEPVRISPPPLTAQEIATFMTNHLPLFAGLPRPARQYFNSWPIFVGNLDNTQNETFLRMVFQQYGALESVKIMRMGEADGHGYGFVNMWNPDEAIVAVLSVHGKEENGRKLVAQFKPLKMQQPQQNI